VRESLKLLAHGIATVLVTPALISFAVRRTIIGRDRALEGSSQALAVVPGLIGRYLRVAFLTHVLERCDRSAAVEFGTLFSQAGARIGAHVYVGPRCFLGLVDLERDVLLGAGVHVPSGAATHGIAETGRPIRDQEGSATRVRIGEGTWVGSNAVILADVGRHCVVGAGAVVTRPLPDYVVAAGVPARVIRKRVSASAVRDVKIVAGAVPFAR
jgi:acetyltransferase-like isoleucine patch superfamily enzyme